MAFIRVFIFCCAWQLPLGASRKTFLVTLRRPSAASAHRSRARVLERRGPTHLALMADRWPIDGVTNEDQ